jgi:hypothetical protein
MAGKNGKAKAEAPPHVFVQEGGRLAPGDPLGMGRGGDLADVLGGLGFEQTQCVGEPAGLNYCLWERRDGGAWVVVFATAMTWCQVLCRTWPDLIDLLERLSPIALASLLADPLNRTRGPAAR